MLIVGQEVIAKFCAKHASAKKTLKAWQDFVTEAEWKTPGDVKRDFSSASFLSGNRVVFNIGGNKYRLLVVAEFTDGMLLVDRVGTHAEYDRWKL